MAPCSRASARVLVRGAAWMPNFLAKESAGNAGSKRVSERHFPKTTDVSLVDQLQALRSGTWPISGFFSKRGRKRGFARNRFARDARRRSDAVARRQRGWRSIARTQSLSDSENRRHVWFPDAARLA